MSKSPIELPMLGQTSPVDPDADIEALRLRSATALESALSFIDTQGSDLAKLRARVMLGAADPALLADWIAKAQAEDGGVAPLGLVAGGAVGFEPESVAGLDEQLIGGLEALVVLSDAALLHGRTVEQLAGYFERVQAADGGWGAVDAPLQQRVFITALIAGLLGRTKVVRDSVLKKAGDLLSQHWSPELVESGSFGVLAGCAAYFSGVHHDLADDALQWIGRTLEKSYRSRRFDAVTTLRVLLHCGAAAVPAATLEPPELLPALLGEQARDGGFSELEMRGPEARVEPTLDAMQAILRLCSLI